MELLGVFAAGLVSVFLLGFQSRLVNTGNYLWAGLCSFSIAIAQNSLWGLLQSARHSWSASLAYGLSGFCAITAAMYIHKRIFKK
jgi:hypothetical protein